MYAKLINNTLHRALKQVQYNGKTIFNPPDNVLSDLGYLPVVYTNMPADAPEDYHYEASWIQSDTEITQVWHLVDDPEVTEPELTADEALAIIMGVAT